jgi:4-diphosphocytidyl-2-C-methyl-D-erythritol kinase
VDLFDELEIEKLIEPTLSMYAICWHEDAVRQPEIDWPIGRDLAARAHVALERHVERTLPIRLKLEKRIPLGAGLGGGSSDAAAILRGVNELFGLRLHVDELAAIGVGIGSDVPFFVHAGSAVVEGFGEKVAPRASVPDLWAVVVLPEVSCSTPAVYGWFDDLVEDGTWPAFRVDDVHTIATHGAPDPDSPFNDLTASAFRAAPELVAIQQELQAIAERPAHLTGSGSSFFVLCDEPLHAESLATAISAKMNLPAIAVSAVAAPSSVQG